MPFVHKDAQGKILAVYNEPMDGTVEVDGNDPALKEFIQQNIPAAAAPPAGAGENAGNDWMQSDLALARVIEDLIEVLIDKKVIMFTDFPEGAQKKLRDRRGLRKEFDLVEDLFGAGEDDTFEVGEGGGEGEGGLL